VLILERPGARPAESLYLRRALAIGDRPRFRVSVERGGDLCEAQLARFRAVVLNDAPWPTAASGRALSEFVGRGGGVVVALGPRGSLGGSGLEGVAQGEVVDRSSDFGGTLAHLDYDHPALARPASSAIGSWTSAPAPRWRVSTTAPPLSSRSRRARGASWSGPPASTRSGTICLCSPSFFRSCTGRSLTPRATWNSLCRDAWATWWSWAPTVPAG